MGFFSEKLTFPFFKGCYIDTGAMDSIGVVAMKKLTPSLCSDECKTVPYFALKVSSFFLMITKLQIILKI